MNIYVISTQSKMRTIDGDAYGDFVVVEYAFVDEMKAKKKLKELNSTIYADRECTYELHETPICDLDRFKFAVMAGMSPAEKENSGG